MSSTHKKGVVPPGPEQCHPSVGETRHAEGCIPIDTLKKVAEKLGIPSDSEGNLRKQIEKSLKLKSPGENTFLETLPLSSSEKASLRKNYLRPPQPKQWLKDPDMWLDSTNISAVLNQYEVSHKNFEFMGPFPIDFGAPNPYKTSETHTEECLMNEICTLSVKDSIQKGITSIGIVYNLDPHYKSGSHWVANFIDLKKKQCIYFDSYGMKAPHQVEKFMKWLTTHDPEIKLYYSSRRLQHKNTECGMFSLYFIIRMLYGDDFTAISRSKPTDADMLGFRSWLFST
jgi:hypothetical protein